MLFVYSFEACISAVSLFSVSHMQTLFAHSKLGAGGVVCMCRGSLRVVWCVGANVKYACQLLRLHKKKVPLHIPPASSSTSPCLIDGALIRNEEV